MTTTAAQDEFNALVANNTHRDTLHPEDRNDPDLQPHRDLDEEDLHNQAQVDAAMRMTTSSSELKLPPVSFDSGRSTGVKGVIADARSYEKARKTTWVDRARSARKSVFGMAGMASSAQRSSSKSESETDDEVSATSDGPDEESFLAQWRESRRRELESEANRAVRTRRTSPSVRIYGRLDEVDALGYLDAIEKVGRETIVVVFVYDHECQVSETIESAIQPLVRAHTAIHFVKVHYEDIEFDNAAVPAILAYRNQGDLFANLTGLIEMMPEDESFSTDGLKKIFKKHGVL